MTFRNRTVALLSALLLLAGCRAAPGALPADSSGGTSNAAAARTHARWIPPANSTYQILYGGSYSTGVAASIYDIDMFDANAARVSALHAMGRKAVCYVDVGTWENWRPDASQFPKSVLGKPDGGWPGERWLDVRQTAILEPIMEKRFEECKAKGFDGMDPDNLDGYQNPTGFPIDYAEQLTYDTWVAQAAHALGLTVAQKGDNGMVHALSKVYDFAVVEQCWVQGWCPQFDVYTGRNALVVDVEYGVPPARFRKKTCAEAAKTGDYAILKHLSLNAWIVTCGS